MDDGSMVVPNWGAIATTHPVFEVYDFQGELLFVAETKDLNGTSGFSYCFHNGIIAFDTEPEDYPKVYLLEIPAC